MKVFANIDRRAYWGNHQLPAYDYYREKNMSVEKKKRWKNLVSNSIVMYFYHENSNKSMG